MNSTTNAAAAEDDAPAAQPKPAKSQRRMARPAPDAEGATQSTTATATSPRASKRAARSRTPAVIALLEREEGATFAELIAATGWLPHTTRAALTGLRKKGHAIERSKRGEDTCYRIALRAPGGVKAG